MEQTRWTEGRALSLLVPSGHVVAELAPAGAHLREDVRKAARSAVESIQPLRPEDVADAVSYIVTRDRRVAANEMLVRASEQTW